MTFSSTTNIPGHLKEKRPSQLLLRQPHLNVVNVINLNVVNVINVGMWLPPTACCLIPKKMRFEKRKTPITS